MFLLVHYSDFSFGLHGVHGGGQPKRPTQNGATTANVMGCFLGRSGLQAGDGRKRFRSSTEDSSPSGTASKPQPWWQRDQQFGSRCPFSAQVQQTAQSTGCQETKATKSVRQCMSLPSTPQVVDDRRQKRVTLLKNNTWNFIPIEV